MHNDVKNLSRRRFLFGAASLTFGTIAGCGGGGSGDGDFQDYFDWTYRSGRSQRVAAALTVDDQGLITYWTRLEDDSDPSLFAADFNQAVLESDRRFDQVSLGEGDDVRTFGVFRRGDRVEGRSENAANSSEGYDWSALRVPEAPALPPSGYVGSFEANRIVDGVGAFVQLGVSGDGNATFFGFFSDLSSGDVYYAFESLSFDPSGAGHDYFFNFDRNLIALRDLSGGRGLRYTFNASDSNLGPFTGRVLDVPLQRSFSQVSVPLERSAAGSRPRPAAASRPVLHRAVPAKKP